MLLEMIAYVFEIKRTKFTNTQFREPSPKLNSGYIFILKGNISNKNLFKCVYGL